LICAWAKALARLWQSRSFVVQLRATAAWRHLPKQVLQTADLLI
jgi:hypothetical protein